MGGPLVGSTVVGYITSLHTYLHTQGWAFTPERTFRAIYPQRLRVRRCRLVCVDQLHEPDAAIQTARSTEAGNGYGYGYA